MDDNLYYSEHPDPTPHQYGVGSIDLEYLVKQPEDNVHTLKQPSNKFKEKVILKQRQAEQQILENRIKRMQTEDQRLQKQIVIAKKHSNLAECVVDRRVEDVKVKQKQEQFWIKDREIKHQKNEDLKEKNKQVITVSVAKVLTANTSKRDIRKHQVLKEVKVIKTLKQTELQNKQVNRLAQYDANQKKLAIKRFDKDAYLDTVTRANMFQAEQITREKEKHDLLCRRLEEIEVKAIGDLQKTLASKQRAVESLNMKSPSLRRTMQPRCAYNSINMKGDISYDELPPSAEFVKAKDSQSQFTASRPSPLMPARIAEASEDEIEQ